MIDHPLPLSPHRCIRFCVKSGRFYNAIIPNSISMNRHLKWAQKVAAHYACHPAVGAIVMGGSAARGTAGPASDVDLGIFWKKVPSVEELESAMGAYGGQLERRVDNAKRYAPDNPRRHGCIEILEVHDSSDTMPFDLEHETIAGTEEVFTQTLENLDPSLENQELLSVLRDGVYLHQIPATAAWQQRAATYPTALAQRTVVRHMTRFADVLKQQHHWLAAGDWTCFHEGTLELTRRLFLALLALNRVWAHTDNFSFKGMGGVIEKLQRQPEQFGSRLGEAAWPDTRGLARFAALGHQVIELATDLGLAVDLEAVRRQGDW